MKRKGIISIGIIIALIATGLLFQRRAAAREIPAFRFVEVEQGDLELTVAATGTLSAVTSVSIGTQVSGQIAELYVDFNDAVSKGQLLARIDPTLAQQAVTDSQASLERVRAELLQAQRDYERNRALVAEGLVANSAFEGVEARLAVVRANLKSAQVSLDRARQNLAYTAIHSPIDGVVVERNVDLGQTVAASLSAPQLFLIANDLSRMQILAEVDESDISHIVEGQSVRFTVQTIQRETFEGTVRQVRLQSRTQDNVVNYTVVIDVDNRQNKLRPGMTASVDFLVSSAADVMKIPNAAFRFRPTEAMLAKLSAESLEESRPPARALADGANGRPAFGRSRSGSGQAEGQPPAGAGMRGERRGQRGAGSGERPAMAQLYYLDQADALKVVRVRTGITDGSMTEIRGDEIEPGMKIIAGVLQNGQPVAANPFGQSGGGPGGGRGRGGF